MRWIKLKGPSIAAVKGIMKPTITPMLSLPIMILSILSSIPKTRLHSIILGKLPNFRSTILLVTITNNPLSIGPRMLSRPRARLICHYHHMAWIQDIAPQLGPIFNTLLSVPTEISHILDGLIFKLLHSTIIRGFVRMHLMTKTLSPTLVPLAPKILIKPSRPLL